MAEHRVRLDEKEFAALVAGKEVKLKTVNGDTVLMILADIGFDRMYQAIDNAEVTI